MEYTAVPDLMLKVQYGVAMVVNLENVTGSKQSASIDLSYRPLSNQRFPILRFTVYTVVVNSLDTV